MDVSLWATGYDWVFNYSEQQKKLLISSIYDYLNARDIFGTIEIGMQSLDYFYITSVDRARSQGLDGGKFLEVKGVDVFKEILKGPLSVQMSKNIDIVIDKIENNE